MLNCMSDGTHPVAWDEKLEAAPEYENKGYLKSRGMFLPESDLFEKQSGSLVSGDNAVGS